MDLSSLEVAIGTESFIVWRIHGDRFIIVPTFAIFLFRKPKIAQDEKCGGVFVYSTE